MKHTNRFEPYYSQALKAVAERSKLHKKELYAKAGRREIKRPLLYMEIVPRFWARYFGYPPEKVDDPETAYLIHLKGIHEHQRIFRDDVPLSIGHPPQTAKNIESRPAQRNPLVEQEVIHETGANVYKPTVKSRGDLELFKVMQDLTYPFGNTGALGAAFYVRGTTEYLMDMMDDPEFARDLIGFLNGLKLKNGGNGSEETVLMNDDVNCDLISPSLYEEFVFPCDAAIATKYKRVWHHSCGNLTPILAKVVTLPNLIRLHISPWTDLAKAVEVMPEPMIIEKHMDPAADVDQTTEKEMRAQMREILNLTQNHPTLIISSSQHGSSIEKTVMWYKIAREEIMKRYPNELESDK
ncbi:MAG: hypothetical protein KKG09_07615 [Verrucomicrobia bacterium]|nr:hypothetical protein [Verrucomicrobiota bacterium]MBU4291920.1 hypothetical protein [Verrucomicrobiota bacterium]MBU4428423.1 hypothetical protein [Verrucomicrobiota bacterium]MBU4497854.1 hypothetical protein [Verrucomicrobiota bacterium]MCG2679315.1 hypothetical protein [Kiritimatiellia bacterium]